MPVGETIPESARDKAWRGMVTKSALEKPNYRADFKLAKIRIDGDTQQRDVDTDVIDGYAELMKDGTKFPPVKMVFDGQDYWLWEGFQRYFAYQKAGIDEIPVYYTTGTQRDARFLSFSANKDHGLPRGPGVKKRIVETILSDPEWREVPASAIASHVGVGQRFVEKVIEEARDKGKPVKRADSRPRKKSKTGGDSAESNGDGVEVEETPAAPEPVTVDELGQELTDPAMIDVFTRAAVFDDHLRAVATLKKAVKAGIGPDPKKPADPLYSFLYWDGFRGDVDDLRLILNNARPYAICPAHAADKLVQDNCAWCRGLGWVSKRNHDEYAKDKNAVPQEETADAK